MIDGQKVLAVVPARGGSKGIKLKNLALFRGKPLIVWAAEIAKKLKYVDRRIVSTDHLKIRAKAEANDLASPFLRPKELSGDFVSDADVLIHALKVLEELDNCTYSIVVMLQPTSPLRTINQVETCIEILAKSTYDCVFTVSETNLKYHPLKQFVLNKNKAQYFDARGKSIIARQELSPTYHKNGIAYAIRRDSLLDQRAVIGDNSYSMVIREKVINIDSMEDLTF